MKYSNEKIIGEQEHHRHLSEGYLATVIRTKEGVGIAVKNPQDETDGRGRQIARGRACKACMLGTTIEFPVMPPNTPRTVLKKLMHLVKREAIRHAEHRLGDGGKRQ